MKRALLSVCSLAHTCLNLKYLFIFYSLENFILSRRFLLLLFSIEESLSAGAFHLGERAAAKRRSREKSEQFSSIM
jgi:hypothetical protein